MDDSSATSLPVASYLVVSHHFYFYHLLIPIMKTGFTRFILLLFAFVLARDVSAQVVTIEGTGTAASHLYNPIYTFNAQPRSYRGAMIYPQSLLAPMANGDLITSLELQRGTLNAGTALPPGNNYKIYLMNTSLNDWGTAGLTWDVSGATLVFDGDPSSIVGTTAGYKQFPLLSAFQYTGGNIAILSEYSQVNGPAASIQWVYQTTTTQPAYVANQMKYLANSSSTMPASLTTSSANHANLKLNYMQSGVCTSPPTPGQATATPSTTACPGAAVILNISGNSTGTGQTYRWLSSPTQNGTYTYIQPAAAAVPNFTVNPTTTTWYKAELTCSGQSIRTTEVQVQVYQPLSGNYTINAGAPAGSNNFQTFAAAVSNLGCAGVAGPVVFDVTNGSYNEQVVLPYIPGSSASNTVLFNGNGSTINFAGVTGERATVRLNDADHVTLDNFIINATGTTYGYGVQLMNNADSNTIRNCTVNISSTSTTAANTAGIIISYAISSPTTNGASNCDSNKIVLNTVNGGYYGVSVVADPATMVNNNVVKGNTITDFYSYGIHLDGTNSTTVDSNNISRPTRGTVTTFYGVAFSGNSNNANVTRNKIHDPFGGATTSTSTAYGIYLSASDAAAGMYNMITNNVVYNFDAGGIQYGLYNSGSDFVKYYHNTISLEDAGYAGTSTTRGFYQTTDADSLFFYNNIVTISRGGAGEKTAIYLNTGTSVFESNNNDLFMNASGGTNYVGFTNSVGHTTLAAWKAATGFDIASKSIDPQYANSAGGDLKPQANPINNIGAPVGIAVDIDSVARNLAAPDPGAYEFEASPCVNPPTAGNAIASGANPVCTGYGVFLDLENNSSGAGQTYTWQSSSTLGGTYTDINTTSGNTSFQVNPTTTTYYQAKVTCGTATRFSVPVAVNIQAPFPGGVYTINPSLPAGSGNFQTISDAIYAVSCGVTSNTLLNVQPNASFNEQIIIPAIPGLSATKKITLSGHGASVSYTSTSTSERAVVKLNGTDYITIDSLVINATGDATGQYGYGIQLINDANNNTISNCTVNATTNSTATNFAGIVVSGTPVSATAVGSDADSNLIINNQVNGGYYGITMVGSSTALLKSNRIVNNTIKDFYFYGIYTASNDSLVIENNAISRPARSTISTFYGIYNTTDGQNLRINSNRISEPATGNTASTSAAYGIYFTGIDAPAGKENIVSNNAIYYFNNSGTQYGFYNSSSDSVWYYHNTISLDDANSTATSTYDTRGFYQVTLATGIKFMNNIVTISRGGASDKHGLYFGTSTTIISSNYNNVYVSSTGGTINAVGYSGADRLTLNDWQTAISQDANSYSLDPQYPNASQGDITPGNTALDNKATPVGVLVDLAGNPRSPSAPDMGAIEFGSIVLPVRLVNFSAVKSGSSALVNWSTASEINCRSFVVERSTDARNFNAIGTVAANGSGASVANYHLTDAQAFAFGNQVYYRLRINNNDGGFEYSKVVMLSAGGLQGQVSLFPNPVKKDAFVKVTLTSASNLELRVVDHTGRIIQVKKQTLSAGSSVIQIPGVDQLAQGVYYIQLNLNGTQQVLKFVK
jgi:hypothetical protein